MLDLLGNGRSAGDILSRTLRLTLGGREWVLPVQPIAGNRRWLAQLDHELAGILSQLRGVGIDGLYAVLAGQIDAMVDLVLSYDTTHVLPERDALLEITYETELIVAVQEVWQAANPLVATAIERLQMSEAQANVTSALTSLRQRNGAGRRARSKKN